jgi:hypothetical protein
MKTILSEVEAAQAAVKNIEDQRQRLVLGAREASFDPVAYDTAFAASDAALAAAVDQLGVAQAKEVAAGGPVYPVPPS